MAAKELINTPLYTDANLVAYWRMEGNANDSKGSNNGTSYNMTYSSSYGKFGSGAHFVPDGRVTLGTGLNSTFQGNFTVSMWMYPTHTPSGTEYFMANDYSSGQRQFAWGVGSDLKLQIERAGSIVTINAGSTLSTSTFQNLVIVYNGTNLITYINGTQNTSNAMTALPSTANTLYLGRREYTGQEGMWYGNMDDVAVFSRALSATEVEKIYTGNYHQGSFMPFF